VESLIKKHRPSIIINCIGHTGNNNVDGCEQDIDKTLFSNAYIPILLAEVAMRHNIRLIHLSSGCIFNYHYGQSKPINETADPDYFKLFYSRSKIYSESALNKTAKHSHILTVRIRIPLDDRPHPKNILNKLIKYRNVINLPNSITYIPDFIKALKFLIRKNAHGTYNITCKGTLLYPDLLKEYQKYYPGFNYKVISLKKLKLSRTNLILSTKKLEQSGFRPRYIKDVIPECVENFINY
jgi:dTDP-4-dehydrorhamnose reductase